MGVVVKDQHTLIKGYRDLSQDEIDLINEIKAAEVLVGGLYQKVRERTNVAHPDEFSGRWASIARTQLETGFMYLIKAVAKPDNGLGRM
jgi:hypothetical protein